MVTGLKPLRIYFNQEGLIRIAAKKFTLNEEFIKNKYVHLTNTGVNSINEDFIVPDNTSNEKANIWNLHMYANRLKKMNVDYNELKHKIHDIIIKSIISVYKNLTLEQKLNNLNDINFYDLLGYDIIITKDKPIKTNLLVDTLNIVGISMFNKNILLYRNKKIKNSVEYNVQNAICELNRPRGDYELIFPLKENINKYRKYFKRKNNKENKMFWNIIQKNG